MQVTDTQNALAGLRRWTLERDDSGPHRVYRDESGVSYASVTHILKETSPQWQKDALDRMAGTTQLLPWSVMLLASAALSRTITRNMSSRRQQSWQEIAQTSEEAGGLEMTAWNVLLKESLPGQSKRPFKGLLESPGAPLGTPEVYGLGSERT